MPSPSKTVASPLVRTIMRAAEVGGMSSEEFVRRTGVTLEEVEDPTARIGRTKYERVLTVMDQLQPPAAPPGDTHGLDWSEANFPVLVAAWLNAPTLRVAVRNFLAYRPILGQFDGVTEREGDSMARVEYVAEGPQKFAPWQAAGNLSVLVHIVRAYDQAEPTRFAAGLVGYSVMTLPVYTSLQRDLPGVELVKADDTLVNQRIIKSDNEIALMKKAFAVSEKAIDAILAEIKPGMTFTVAVAADTALKP